MIRDDGWFDQATRRPSPNFDERPAGTPIDLLVIHNISLPPGQFGGPWIEALFQNRLPVGEHPYFETVANLRVSTHLLIRRDGEVIQFVSLDKRAWHAGESQFRDRTRCNDFSIGIELEGADDIVFSEPQYRMLAETAQIISSRYPSITEDHIVGHSDISPGRKTDPGPRFDWTRFRRDLRRAKEVRRQ